MNRELEDEEFEELSSTMASDGSHDGVNCLLLLMALAACLLWLAKRGLL